MVEIVSIALGLVMGLVGGVIHQLYESEQKNDFNSIIRSLIVGMIAGIVSVIAYPALATSNEGLLSLLVAGYMGDSIILNLIRRRGKKINDGAP